MRNIQYVADNVNGCKGDVLVYVHSNEAARMLSYDDLIAVIKCTNALEEIIGTHIHCECRPYAGLPNFGEKEDLNLV